MPQASPALDAFRRYYWRDLEARPASTIFPRILADLAAARQSGRKFAFRLRMMAGYTTTTPCTPRPGWSTIPSAQPAAASGPTPTPPTRA
ncbi:hypothetical protein LP419_03710 [Massilia sp. H-1]|nr:hypothetical protein LP419_03710 [Massilia sp. H-1]